MENFSLDEGVGTNLGSSVNSIEKEASEARG